MKGGHNNCCTSCKEAKTRCKEAKLGVSRLRLGVRRPRQGVRRPIGVARIPRLAVGARMSSTSILHLILVACSTLAFRVVKR